MTDQEILDLASNSYGIEPDDTGDIIAFARAILSIASVAVQESDDADHHTIMRMGELLAGVAVALKGQEEARKRHGYQDLPQLVQAKVFEIEILKQQIAMLKPTYQRVCGEAQGGEWGGYVGVAQEVSVEIEKCGRCDGTGQIETGISDCQWTSCSSCIGSGTVK